MKTREDLENLGQNHGYYFQRPVSTSPNYMAGYTLGLQLRHEELCPRSRQSRTEAEYAYGVRPNAFSGTVTRANRYPTANDGVQLGCSDPQCEQCYINPVDHPVHRTRTTTAPAPLTEREMNRLINLIGVNQPPEVGDTMSMRGLGSYINSLTGDVPNLPEVNNETGSEVQEVTLRWVEDRIAPRTQSDPPSI